MKNDWSKVEAEFDYLDRELERIETLVWRLCAGVFGFVVLSRG